MPASKKPIGINRLKREATRIINSLKDSNALKLVIDMDDPDYCRKRAIEELQRNVTDKDRDWAVMLLLYANEMERKDAK